VAGSLGLWILLAATAAYAAPPRLALDYPDGGEYFVVGTTQVVRLAPKAKASSVLVELSRDGGTTFTSLGTIAVQKGVQGQLEFTVSDPASTSAMIRVSGTVKGATVTATSRLFTIGPVDEMITATAGDVLTANGMGGAGWLPSTLTVPQVADANSDSAALQVLNAGAGDGLSGGNLATTGSTTGVRGEAASTSHGTGAAGGVTGVLGVVTPTTPGRYSAGVRCVHHGTGGTRIRVGRVPAGPRAGG